MCSHAILSQGVCWKSLLCSYCSGWTQALFCPCPHWYRHDCSRENKCKVPLGQIHPLKSVRTCGKCGWQKHLMMKETKKSLACHFWCKRCMPTPSTSCVLWEGISTTQKASWEPASVLTVYRGRRRKCYVRKGWKYLRSKQLSTVSFVN